MKRSYARRRVFTLLVILIIVALNIVSNPELHEVDVKLPDASATSEPKEALYALSTLEIKGRAPKTGYTRAEFGRGWSMVNGCDTRNIILHRDLMNTIVNLKCQVLTGVLNDPYTGQIINFERGEVGSQLVQIDHVVALSDAWQKGAQNLPFEKRVEFSNDPLGLLAVDGPANQQKADSDAASWLPSNKPFRCQFVARQIAVKQKYSFWVTQAEHDTMHRVLRGCPGQMLPVDYIPPHVY